MVRERRSSVCGLSTLVWHGLHNREEGAPHPRLSQGLLCSTRASYSEVNRGGAEGTALQMGPWPGSPGLGGESSLERCSKGLWVSSSKQPPT
jgi:hypothetical protein